MSKKKYRNQLVIGIASHKTAMKYVNNQANPDSPYSRRILPHMWLESFEVFSNLLEADDSDLKNYERVFVTRYKELEDVSE